MVANVLAKTDYTNEEWLIILYIPHSNHNYQCIKTNKGSTFSLHLLYCKSLFAKPTENEFSRKTKTYKDCSLHYL